MARPATTKKRIFASPEERESFILANAGIAVSAANSNDSLVGKRGLEFEDLLQSAWVEIIRAADHYDPLHPGGAAFSTYAYRGVKRAVMNAGINQVNTLIVKEGQFSRAGKACRKPKTDAAVKSAKEKRLCSLGFDPVGKTQSPDELASNRERHEILLSALRKLPAFERWVVMHVYGIGCETQTMKWLGDQMGLCRERIRQVKIAALARLRNLLSDIGDEP